MIDQLHQMTQLPFLTFSRIKARAVN